MDIAHLVLSTVISPVDVAGRNPHRGCRAATSCQLVPLPFRTVHSHLATGLALAALAAVMGCNEPPQETLRGLPDWEWSQAGQQNITSPPGDTDRLADAGDTDVIEQDAGDDIDATDEVLPPDVIDDTPPGDAGIDTPDEDTPPGDTGVDTPAEDVGIDTPPRDVGVDTPPRDVGIDTPPRDVGVDTPPEDIGVDTPIDTTPDVPDVGPPPTGPGPWLDAGPITEPAPDGLCEATGSGRCWYVALSGRDGNAGTWAAPFYSFERALEAAGPGDVVYVREGVYGAAHRMVTETRNLGWGGSPGACGAGEFYQDGYCFRDEYAVVSITYHDGWGSPIDGYSLRDGTEAAPITFKAYPGERVVLDANGVGDVAVYVYRRSHWIIEGFEIAGGMVNIVGAANFDQTHDITIRHNEIRDVTMDGGDNPGLIRIDRGTEGGAYNVFIEQNILRGIYDIASPGDWYNVADWQHFSALTVISREQYLGVAGGGTGYIEMTGNILYELPMGFFFKNPMEGPALIEGNYFFDTRRIGILSASNVTLRGNLFDGVELGWMKVGGPSWGIPALDDLFGNRATIEYNTFVGLDVLMYIDSGVDHLIRRNVFFGLDGRTTGAGFETTAYLIKSEIAPEPTATSSSLLRQLVSDENCFVSAYNDWQYLMRRIPPATGGWLIDHYDFGDGRATFGLDATSTFVRASSAAQVFADPAGLDYSLRADGGCPVDIGYAPR